VNASQALCEPKIGSPSKKESLTHHNRSDFSVQDDIEAKGRIQRSEYFIGVGECGIPEVVSGNGV
jgi:hypothetical protein